MWLQSVAVIVGLFLQERLTKDCGRSVQILPPSKRLLVVLPISPFPENPSTRPQSLGLERYSVKYRGLLVVRNMYRNVHPNGDNVYRALNACLSVPSDPEIREIANLDRIVARFVVTDDATLQCEAKSSSTGKVDSCEIYDLSFGLKLK